MGANSPLNTPSVEDECGGAIFSEVPFTFTFSYIFLMVFRFSCFQQSTFTFTLLNFDLDCNSVALPRLKINPTKSIECSALSNV